MKKSKRVQGRVHTGNYDWVNIIACLLLLVYNSIDIFIKDLFTCSSIIYFAPYIIYPITQLFYRSKNSTIILYTIVGFLTISLVGDPMSISGIIYIYFAYNEIRDNKSPLVLGIISFIALSIRFYIIDATSQEVIISIILFAFIFATFYFKIIKDKTRLSNLPVEIKSILKLYCDGNNYEKISLTLGLGVTPGTVRRKITAFMNKNDIKNDAQLGKWLHRNA